MTLNSFTRFLFAFALPKINAKLIARSLTSSLLCLELPELFFSDKGPKFKNAIVHSLMIEWGVKHTFIIIKNPQANKQSEVSVRKITQKLLTALQQASYLHHKVEEQSKYWDRVLPAIIYGMNITYLERLGCSPYELMFGQLPPLYHMLRIKESNLLNRIRQSFYATLLTSLEILYQTARRKQSLFPLILTPFNCNETVDSAKRRNTVVTKMAFLPIYLAS